MYPERTCPTVWVVSVMPKKDAKMQRFITPSEPMNTFLYPKYLMRYPFRKAPMMQPAILSPPNNSDSVEENGS